LDPDCLWNAVDEDGSLYYIEKEETHFECNFLFQQLDTHESRIRKNLPKIVNKKTPDATAA
jgi:hypothetical protein